MIFFQFLCRLVANHVDLKFSYQLQYLLSAMCCGLLVINLSLIIYLIWKRNPPIPPGPPGQGVPGQPAGVPVGQEPPDYPEALNPFIHE